MRMPCFKFIPCFKQGNSVSEPERNGIIPGDECGAEGKMWGTDVLIDAHTVVLAEGTEAEVPVPSISPPK